MLGTAAIRSTRETSSERSRGGAYSLMNSAVSSPSGNATTIATAATSKVPMSVDEIPILSSSGSHWLSLKKPKPYRRMVGIAW